MALRRPKNLKDILVRARVNKPEHNPASCDQDNCYICWQLKNKRFKVFNRVTKKQVHTVEASSCEVRNVVYILTCTQSGQQYIGETKRPFSVRFFEHLANIRNNTPTTRNMVSKHFNLPKHKEAGAHPIPKILAILPGDPERTAQMRKSRERTFIHRMKTYLPFGMNVQE